MDGAQRVAVVPGQLHLNKGILDRHSAAMAKYCFDSTKDKTDLDQVKAQFGCSYPTVRPGGHEPAAIVAAAIVTHGADLATGGATTMNGPWLDP